MFREAAWADDARARSRACKLAPKTITVGISRGPVVWLSIILVHTMWRQAGQRAASLLRILLAGSSRTLQQGTVVVSWRRAQGRPPCSAVWIQAPREAGIPVLANRTSSKLCGTQANGSAQALAPRTQLGDGRRPHYQQRDRRDARRAARAPPLRAVQAPALHRPQGSMIGLASQTPRFCPMGSVRFRL